MFIFWNIVQFFWTCKQIQWFGPVIIRLVSFIICSLFDFRGVQWNSPKNGAKTGSSWTPQPMAATTGAGYRPMVCNFCINFLNFRTISC